jgi:hypothetical protein
VSLSSLVSLADRVGTPAHRVRQWACEALVGRSPRTGSLGSTFRLGARAATWLGLLVVVGMAGAAAPALLAPAPARVARTIPDAARAEPTIGATPTPRPVEPGALATSPPPVALAAAPTPFVPSPAPTPFAPSPAPTPTLGAVDAWQALAPRLDSLWGTDTPGVIDLLERFQAQFPDFGPAKEKLYASYIARAAELARQGAADEAAVQLEHARALRPERPEAGAELMALTPTPSPPNAGSADATLAASRSLAPAGLAPNTLSTPRQPTPRPQPTARPTPPPPARPAPPPPAPIIRASLPTPTKVPFVPPGMP